RDSRSPRPAARECRRSAGICEGKLGSHGDGDEKKQKRLVIRPTEDRPMDKDFAQGKKEHHHAAVRQSHSPGPPPKPRRRGEGERGRVERAGEIERLRVE